MKRSPERITMEVVKGGLKPVDDLSVQRLREKGLRVGEPVLITLKQPRNIRFHRLAHVFGQMVADNIEAFEGMSCHHALKRLQIESGVGCEEIAVVLGGLPALYRARYARERAQRRARP